MSHTRAAWTVSRRSVGMISPLAIAGLILVVVIAPDSPSWTVAAVGVFIVALCYVLARVVDDVKASQAAAAEQARLHREALTKQIDAAAAQAKAHREMMGKQLLGGVSHEALTWLGAHDRQVTRFEHATEALQEAYGPPSDGLSRSRLRAVRDNGRVTPSA